MDREFDLVLYGATGFTGRLAAKHLLQTYTPASHPEVRYALAGRSQHALDELLADKSVNPLNTQVPTIIVDANSPESLEQMAQRTCVVASCVGPFIQLGEPLVKACVEARTNYVDMTGELSFVKEIIDKYSARAAVDRVKIVPCCGYDYLIADMTASYAIQNRKLEGEGDISVSRVETGAVANVSAGTVRSAVAELREGGDSSALSLVSKEAYPGSKVADFASRYASRPRYLSDIETYSTPSVMSAAETRFVYWSMSCRGERGKSVLYSTGAYASSLFTAILELLKVRLIFLVLALAARSGWLESQLLRWVPMDGGDLGGREIEGQMIVKDSENVRADVYDYRLLCDPYTFTGFSLVEAGLHIAKSPSECPSRFGVLPASVALGGGFLSRLMPKFVIRGAQ